MRVDKQAEGEEDDQLAEPSETIEKVNRRAFMDETRIAHDNAADVDGEIAVSAHEIGGREDENAGSQNKNRIKTRIINLNLIDDPNKRVAENETNERTDSELLNQLKESVKIIGLTALGHKTYESDGEHIGHRVIGAALKLEHGAEVVFQVKAFAAEN